MAYQQNFGAPSMSFGSEADISLKQKQNAVAQAENVNGCFDCNICLESSHDPIVTLCGHLYCWPCIYKWLQVQNSSIESDEEPKCPVCKAYISASSLVPLYGRGTSSSDSEAKKRHLDLVIPHRPPALLTNTMLASATSNQQHHPNGALQEQHFSHPFDNSALLTPTFGGSTRSSVFNPTINMVSEMVFARMSGNSDVGLFAYPHANLYPFAGNVSPRLRRQEIQVDKSLNRVSIFLFCCIALCLILF